MALADTVDRVASGVFHIVYIRDGQRIGSGTAFVSCGYVITNFHVAQAPAACEVWIRRAGDREEDGFRLSGQDFRFRQVAASMEGSYDFAILSLPEVVNRPDTHSFVLRGSKGSRVGELVAFLGFPYEHENLTCHSGIISSTYRAGPVDMIQLDASVNPSNSGGPLVDPETGEVLGIVTRRATGLTKAFASLRASLEENIRALSGIGADIGFGGGISFRQSILIGQNQILLTLGEIERQANVGIGYAFSIDHVMGDNVIYRAMHGD